MKITTFAKLICKMEGKKKQVNIAQVMEILKIERKIFKQRKRLYCDIDIYRLIHNL